MHLSKEHIVKYTNKKCTMPNLPGMIETTRVKHCSIKQVG